MKGNRSWLRYWPYVSLSLAGLIALGVIAVWLFRPGEPAYEGRPLSYLIDQLWTPPDGYGEGRAGLRAIGPDAIPFLVWLAKRQDSAWLRLYRSLWPTLPAVFQNRIPQPAPVDYTVHQRIGCALAFLGPEVAPRIIPLLDDKCAGVRLAAVVALSQLRQNPDQAIPALVRLLQDPNGLIRVYSVTLLDGMASRTQIVPELIRALQDSDAGPPPAAPRASVPRFSTRGLIDSGTNADPKAPSLGRGASGIPTSPRGRTLLPPGMSLGSSRVAVRGNAATALGHIGPAARAAVPELTKLLRDPDPFVRQQSAIALWRIDGATHVVPLIVAELQSPENPPTWNRALLKVLGEMGSAAKPARAAVLKLSREEAEVGSGFKVSAEVSALAREVLAKIGTDP